MRYDDLVNYFSLRENSIVFDAGGYQGDWTYELLKRNPSATVYIFEPVVSYCDNIKNRYKEQSNVKVFNFGLSDKDRDVNISIEGDSSSIYSDTASHDIKLMGIENFIKNNNIKHVDLFKMNIEGEEYRLMEKLVESEYMKIFKNFLIQYHRFNQIDNYVARRDAIINKMKVSYKNIFNNEFTWEAWGIKND
jgi:FkbM family methyltransferase